MTTPGGTEQQPHTPAELRIHAELARLLAPDTGFRAGVLVLTYKRDPAAEGLNFATTVQMTGLDTALDVVMMIRRLRGLADELEAVVKGQAPLPKEPT